MKRTVFGIRTASHRRLRPDGLRVGYGTAANNNVDPSYPLRVALAE